MNMLVGSNTTTPASSAGHAPVCRPPPPPAHVTHLTSSPALGQVQHVVQHHPAPAPAPPRESNYHRAAGGSPHQQRGGGSRSRSHSGRPTMHNYPTNKSGSAAVVMPAPPAHHQLLLPTSVNSPSLIPQNIPPSFLPQIPLHISPLPRSSVHNQPRRLNSPHHPPDSMILPPHSFKKTTRTAQANHDEPEVQSSATQNVGRRNLVSPRHRERRNVFSHVALQDHNYCAIPPPSPPRSPTPPLSPFPHSVVMGAQLQPAQAPASDNLSFGIAGYKAVGAYPSPHFAGPQVAQEASPLSRLKQSIEDAGVGPMTPLGEEESPLSGDKSNDSRPSPERDGGEETETAPEAEDEGVEDEAVTRCICEFLHDDGYMICCDKCSVWQHVVCMFLDKNNIPDEYLCEKCQPRPVDKKRAKAVQRAREKEIFKTVKVDSSDEDKKPATTAALKARKSGLKKGAAATAGLKRSVAGEKKPEKKSTKRPAKRRPVKTDSSSSLKTEQGIKKPSPRKLHRRKSASATDIETEEEPPNDAMSLRSWIDTYEEAVTNHYSPELRARLQGAKLPINHFKPKEVNGIRERCNVSLRGNGMKALTANSYIPANTPVIECRGKYMLANQLASRARTSHYTLFHRLTSDIEVCVDSKTYGNDSRFCRRAHPNNAEFNAEVKHHLDKGSLHLYIVSTKNIEKNQEIILSSENKNGMLPSLSIQEEIRQIRKVNGLAEERKNRKSSNAKRRLKRECVKKELCESSSEDETPVSFRKTRSNAIMDRSGGHDSKGAKAVSDVKPTKSVNFEIKEEKEEPKEVPSPAQGPSRKVVKAEKESTEEESPPSPAIKNEAVAATSVTDQKKSPAMAEELPLDTKPEKLEELKIEIKEETVNVPGADGSKKPIENQSDDVFSPTSSAADASGATPAKSPGKPVMGLPDQSGLIVGVNTINYDAGLRRKSKTREEKKMEMILKAIEAMERAEARKKSDGSDCMESLPKKRRRSNSTKKETAESNPDGSSGDEACADPKERAKVAKVKRRRNISTRRRSRAKSGDSLSAMSAEEGGNTPNLDGESSGTPGENNQPFKFPFKKQNHDAPNDRAEVDDVSGHYIRGSRSPPGIANHLLRSAVTNHAGIKSPTKSIGGSAKKRWLRAAMSEDHSEDHASPGQAAIASPGQSNVTASPGQASPEPDYTPLKKRRLATYNESTEDKAKEFQPVTQEDKTKQELVTEKIKSLPNGLKKRLISNLLLEAVLDNAMQDLLPEPSDKETETGKENQDGADNPDKPSQESPSKKKAKTPKKGRSKRDDKEDLPATSEVISGEKPDFAGSYSEPLETEGGTTEGQSQASVSGPVGKQTPETDENASKTALDMAVVKDGPPSPPSLAAPPVQAPTPVQHSVFKSFFSTDLSFDEIDRQMEAKRLELARETSMNSVQSPRYESLSEEARPFRASITDDNSSPHPSLITEDSKAELGPAADTTPSTPSLPKKKVTIADYKRRKQASRSDSVDDSSDQQQPLASLLASPSILSSGGVPVSSLPELPGLEARRPHPPPPTDSPVFGTRKTRSNSPLSFEKKTRSSPRETKVRSPQADRRPLPRTVSPKVERRTGSHALSPARVRDRTISPRKPSSGTVKQEKWESKTREASTKGRPPSSHSNHKRAREPVASTKPAPSLRPATAAPITYAPRPHIPTPDEPREDLTERLRKEFGLNIEESEGDATDSESSDRENGPNQTEEMMKSAAAAAATKGPPAAGEGWSGDYGY